METFTLSHFPTEVRKVHIALFREVTNAPQIRQRLIAAATTEGPEGDEARKEVDFGFIEGTLVSSHDLNNPVMQKLIPVDSLPGTSSHCYPNYPFKRHNPHWTPYSITQHPFRALTLPITQ
jgi:hypothetical protein